MKNLIDNVIIVPSRRKGNTTRQIDMAIQHIFNGEIVKVIDHADDGHNRRESNRLFNLILKRLDIEHDIREIYSNSRDNVIHLKGLVYGKPDNTPSVDVLKRTASEQFEKTIILIEI